VGLAVPLLLATVPASAAPAKPARPRAESPKPARTESPKPARIETAKPSPHRRTREPAPATRRAREPEPSRLGHTVREGDTVWTIARRYGVGIEDLVQLNRLQRGQPLRIGQLLAIPKTPASADSEEPASLAEIVLGQPPSGWTVVFGWPVPAVVNSPFGPRRRGWHGGIDLQAERGTPIRAAAPGMVVMSGRERFYGRVVKIWHHEDFMTVYAHNLENYVKVGDWVERGQIVGTIGASGRATAPHLHFEIRLGSKKYNPLHFLPPTDTVEVAAGAPPEDRHP
jgi:murein DD-endopeptidase MepM/ murein hydrolase activator NlpD